MGKLIASESVTLDGVFEDPAKSPGATFKYAGWAEPYQSREQAEYLSQGISGEGALLLGRRTYEHMQAGWENASGPVADFMNNAKKYVASRSLSAPGWKNVTLLKGDMAQAVAKLKEQLAGLAILGSADLARTLRAAGLIDEFQLLVYPLVLGEGQRFFESGLSKLKLKEAKPFSSGVVLMTYEPDRQ
jgi:dihydrofolate reductase